MRQCCFCLIYQVCLSLEVDRLLHLGALVFTHLTWTMLVLAKPASCECYCAPTYCSFIAMGVVVLERCVGGLLLVSGRPFFAPCMLLLWDVRFVCMLLCCMLVMSVSGEKSMQTKDTCAVYKYRSWW